MRNVALIVLALSGCGADGGSGGALSTLPEYQLAIVSSFCDVDVRCGIIGASQKGLCLQLARVQVKTAVDYQALLDAKHITFDAAKASMCLDAQRHAGCDGRIDPAGEAACRESLHGLVPPGGGCLTSNECDGGWCDNATSGCTGKCVAYIATGGSCADKGRCDPRVDACDVSGTVTCKPLGKAGDPCIDSYYCQDGLACIPGSSPPARVCGTPGADGAPCAGRDGCAGGFYCTIAMRCKARVAAGSACESPWACQDGLACVGFDGSPGTCRARGPTPAAPAPRARTWAGVCWSPNARGP